MPTYNGTNASEGIQGTDEADTIHGNGGNDQIAGAGGNDTLYGDDGDDLILGEAGNDIIWGGAGNDQLDGGAGSDVVHGGSGDDDIWFGAGDTLFGDDGSDLFIGVGSVLGTVIDGGSGFDLVDFTNVTHYVSIRLNDALSGDMRLTGIEFVAMSAFGGVVYGGSVDEEMIGRGGADSFYGGGGDDWLIGGGGNDILMGGAGDDYVDGGLGDDILDGGEGIDTLSYVNLSYNFHVDLSITGPQNTNYGYDTITGFEIVLGGTGADILRGGSGNELLDGGGWDDIIAGGGGDDILRGGEGYDTVDYSRAAGGVTVSLATQGVTDTGGDGIDTLSGFEAIIGSAFDDVLTGDDGNMNSFVGGGGSDRINGGAGYDIVYYGSWAQAGDTATDLIRDIWRDINNTVFVRTADGAIDTLIGIEGIGFTNSAIPGLSTNQIGIIHQGTDAAEQFYGGSGMDIVRGGGGDDIIHGGPADGSDDRDDVLYGEAGDDQLFGDGGTDTLYGGEGNDRLTGGSYGRNQLYGGTGDDTYFIGDHENTPDTIVEELGEGTDTVIFDGKTFGLAANVENLVWVGTRDGTGGYAGVYGNDLANTITGNAGNNDISGEGGSDVISGGDGNDIIWAESRTEALVVGLGNDTLNGDAGDDTLYGGRGDDLLRGGDGVDHLYGGLGRDWLSGGAGNDVLDGGAGTDVAEFDGPRSAYVVTASGNVVTVSGPDGVDTLVGVEILIFNDGNLDLSVLVGTPQNDVMPGTAGNDYLSGYGGDDIMMGSAGDDIFDGGEGSDRVDYRNATGGVVVDLALSIQAVGADQGEDQLISIENVTGSEFADRLTSGITGQLEGLGGDDILTSSAFGGTYLGGNGNDTIILNRTALAASWQGPIAGVINGGAGFDTLDLRGIDFKVRINNDSGAFKLSVGGLGLAESFRVTNTERLLTGAGADELYFTGVAVALQLETGAGADIIAMGTLGGSIDAGEGDDEIVAGAASGATVVHAGAGADTITFGQADTVYGGAGNDLFKTYAAANGLGGFATVNGGDGIDTLLLSNNAVVDLTTGWLKYGEINFARLESIENIDVYAGLGTTGPTIGDDAANTFRVITLSQVATHAVDFRGMGGDDILQGHRSNDRLDGGTGDDIITGGLGNDLINGGDGHDVVIVSGVAADYRLLMDGDNFILKGPDGRDSLSNVETIRFGDGRVLELNRMYGADIDARAWTDGRIPEHLLSDGTPGGPVIGDRPQVMPGADDAGPVWVKGFGRPEVLPPPAVEAAPLVLVGTAGDDVLTGGDDDDDIRGLGGNDILSGGAGADLLMGGDGDDIILGDEGQDTIDGGAGIDTYVIGGNGGRVDLFNTARQITGQGGDLFISIENVRGSAGDDNIRGDAADNRLEGGDGNDYLDGLWGADLMYGGAGNDDIRASISGDDIAWGGDGNDHILAFRWGSHAADFVTLYGEAGNDELRVTAENRGIDSVVLSGGAGNDSLEVAGAAHAVMDGGDGDDRISVFEGAGSYDIRLGQGRDLIDFRAFNWDGTGKYGTGGSSIVVQDFATGDAGDQINLLTLIPFGFTNFSAGQNYFSTGHFRLVQDGVDTRLELDRNGGGDNFSLLMVLRNTQKTAFTTYNFDGYSPTGGGVAGKTLTGTENYDQIHGTAGDDVIYGLGAGDLLFGHEGDDLLDGGEGNDTLEGGDGHDWLEGGAGDDQLRDSGGNDVLIGGAGNDTLLVRPDGLGPFSPPFPGSTPTGPAPRGAYTILMDGGDGDDRLEFSATNRWIDTVTAIGGDGADFINVEFALNANYFAGAGDDEMKVTIGGGNYEITTGAGSDKIVMAYAASLIGADGPLSLRVMDFTGGAGGDRLDVWDFVQTRFGNDDGRGAFAMGRLHIMQTGGNSYLQVRDAQGSGYTTLVTLAGTEAWTLTHDNFVDYAGSYAPGGLTIIGLAADEVLRGGVADDIITGGGGGDVITGGLGNDLIDGGTGDDVITGGLGNDIIDGGAGNDVVVVSGVAADYRLLMNGDDFILKGPDGRDNLTNVETIRFGDGWVLELNRIYGPDTDAWAWSDGRIPEHLLSDGTPVGARPQVMPGADDAGPVWGKGFGRPEVMPTGEGDFVLTSGFEGPLVLPAVIDDGLSPGGFDLALPGFLLALEANPMISYGRFGPHLASDENPPIPHPQDLHVWG